MRRLDITATELDKIDPTDLIYASWVGSDDILVLDGAETIDMITEGKGNIPLSEALTRSIAEQSGNSFEFILIRNGKPHKLWIDWDK